MASAAPDRRLHYRIWAALCRTPLHGLSLVGRTPTRLAQTSDERWPGDSARGTALLANIYRFGGETVASPGPPWKANGASAEWQAALHGFGWLADLAALGSEVAMQRARSLTRSWLQHQERWQPIAWRADVLGERLSTWVAHAELIAPSAGGDMAFRNRFLRSIARQVRHLRRTASWEVSGIGRLQALTGLLTTLLALDAGDRELDKALRRLEREVEAQILGDGGHCARSPQMQLAALRHLIDARGALRAANIEASGPLNAAIERAAPMLRFFRHGDTRFALFNDTMESDPAAIDLLLGRAGAKGRAPSSAPETGFERLQSGKALIILDCGAPPDQKLGGHPHAGTLSFEMSYGRERLIVNCGAYRGISAAWHTALRTTAAHSTLVVADTPSSDMEPDGSLGARPRSVTRERAEDPANQWIAASHDGYMPRFGLTHARQLYLAPDGEDLRGEDRLTGPSGQSFAIRFHLHPQVQASLTQDGSAALLRLPSGVGWRLRAQGAVMSLAESVYLGNGEIKKTQQLVLDGHVGTAGAMVKWAIRREGRKASETVAEPQGDG